MAMFPSIKIYNKIGIAKYSEFNTMPKKIVGTVPNK